MKLGSLFDGIGGFPLAATMLGIEPVWASEIEKFPIAVTKERFPNMKHLGSVCDIKGAEVEPVDIITFGSPCQDLSVAGKRAGMGEGTRSGLFSEAVRIIKEMRDGTGRTFPRYAVWENVPGAFSSNHGEDFRAVVESLAKVAEAEVSIPLPKDGKWEPAGLVEGDRWSIAWRTLDAQFWGVPQRRKRIFLVADFGGQRASEIFFEREGVSWNPAKSGSSGQEVTGGVEGGVRATGFDGYNSSETGEQSATLGVNCGMSTGRNGIVVGFQTWIEYDQFTQWDSQQFPECDNNEYLNYKEISGTICSYGYRRCYDVGNGVTRFQWIKQNEALKELESLKVAGFKQGNSPSAGSIGYGEEVSPTLTSGTSGTNMVPTICLHATQDPTTAENRSRALSANSSQVVLFDPRSQDGVPRIHKNGICSTLNTAKGGQRQPCVLMDASGSIGATLTANNGDSVNNQTPLAVFTKGELNGIEIENNTRKILFELRQEVGEKAFAEWRFRMLDQLQQKEILQSQLHGTSVQKETKEVIPSIHDCSLSCQKHNSSGELSGMPEAERNRCSSQGRKLAEQCARELGATMPELPQSQAQAEKFLFDMSETSEGIRILRQALSEVQEVWQSFNIKSQTVRRLTPKEAERLQGFPDNWTNIPRASDSARYKALGNSVAIPCVYFILSCLRRN